jgi:hypothetical protein
MDFEGFSDRDIPRGHLKDAAGRFRTNIFYDFNKSRHEDYPPIYTMREEPFNGLPSAYLIYMYSNSEYEAALKLVGSWQHWLKLLKSGPFVNGQDDYSQWLGLQAWRDEKEIMDKATAYLQLQVQAGQGSVPAQKIIFDGVKTASKRGRPSKEQIQKAAAEQAHSLRETKSDLKRIKLVVNGNKSGSS